MKVILVAALTVDGKIGLDSGHFPDWTEPADKKLFQRVSRKAGVIIMGSRTFDTFGAALPGRKHVVLTRNEGRKSDTPQVVFTSEGPARILAGLAKEGYDEVILGGGSRINHLFAEQGLIDEILVTFSPKIFGAGLSLFSDLIRMDLALIETGSIGEHTLFAHYRVVR